MNQIDLMQNKQKTKFSCAFLLKTLLKNKPKSRIKRKIPDFGWRIKFLMREDVL